MDEVMTFLVDFFFVDSYFFPFVSLVSCVSRCVESICLAVSILYDRKEVPITSLRGLVFIAVVWWPS